MLIRNLCRGGWASNCYLVSQGTDSVVIDPSSSAEEITDVLTEAGMTLRGILLTHGHFDHILSLDTLRDTTGAPAYLHRGDGDFPSDPGKNCYLGFLGRDIRHRGAEVLLEGDEVLTFGALTFRVLHTPGHTPGSVCLAVEDPLFAGDTLFAASIGRTDFPGGDYRQMLQSLHRLALLPGDYRVLPGHAEESTLEAERKTNPFMQNL